MNLSASYLSLHTVLNDKRNVNLVDINMILLIMFFYKIINVAKCSFSLSGSRDNAVR